MAKRVTIRELQFLSGGLLLGANIGWFAAKRYLETKYDKVTDELRDKYIKDLRRARSEYEQARQNWEKPELDEVVEELGYSTDEDEDEVEERYSHVEREAIDNINNEVMVEEAQIVFDNNPVDTTLDDTWNWDDENEKRRQLPSGVPFVLHKEEFFEGDEQYDQTTLTYYAGDDVLCDERDEIIEPRDHIIGGWNLKLFGTGHGSGDPNVLYIRNPRTFNDFEVVMNDAKYSEDALGFLEHAFERNRRRQRHFDDE